MTNDIKNFEFEKITRSGEEKSVEAVAVEKSYNLIVNDVRVASIMDSPSDLKELGYGYLLSEGIVKSKDQIISVSVKGAEIDAFVGRSKKLEKWTELRSSGCVGFTGRLKKKTFLSIRTSKLLLLLYSRSSGT